MPVCTYLNCFVFLILMLKLAINNKSPYNDRLTTVLKYLYLWKLLTPATIKAHSAKLTQLDYSTILIL